MDQLDLLKLLSTKTFNADIHAEMSRRLGVTSIAALSEHSEALFVLMDFLLIKNNIEGSEKTYKDFRDDLRVLLVELSSSINN